jgi:L-rhamnose mutarotase
MQKFCLALDLVDDATLIAEYEAYHKEVWPEIKESILGAGIIKLDIYRVFNRMFMIIEATDDFSFEVKAAADASNPKVQEWEILMWKFQQAIPGTKPGEKWQLMNQIFDLNN